MDSELGFGGLGPDMASLHAWKDTPEEQERARKARIREAWALRKEGREDEIPEESRRDLDEHLAGIEQAQAQRRQAAMEAEEARRRAMEDQQRAFEMQQQALRSAGRPGPGAGPGFGVQPTPRWSATLTGAVNPYDPRAPEEGLRGAISTGVDTFKDEIVPSLGGGAGTALGAAGGVVVANALGGPPAWVTTLVGAGVAVLGGIAGRSVTRGAQDVTRRAIWGDEAVDQANEELRRRQAEHPWATRIGAGVASIPEFVAPMGKLGTAATASGKALRGAASGGGKLVRGVANVGGHMLEATPTAARFAEMSAAEVAQKKYVDKDPQYADESVVASALRGAAGGYVLHWTQVGKSAAFKALPKPTQHAIERFLSPAWRYLKSIMIDAPTDALVLTTAEALWDSTVNGKEFGDGDYWGHVGESAISFAAMNAVFGIKPMVKARRANNKQWRAAYDAYKNERAKGGEPTLPFEQWKRQTQAASEQAWQENWRRTKANYETYRAEQEKAGRKAESFRAWEKKHEPFSTDEWRARNAEEEKQREAANAKVKSVLREHPEFRDVATMVYGGGPVGEATPQKVEAFFEAIGMPESVRSAWRPGGEAYEQRWGQGAAARSEGAEPESRGVGGERTPGAEIARAGEQFGVGERLAERTETAETAGTGRMEEDFGDEVDTFPEGMSEAIDREFAGGGEGQGTAGAAGVADATGAAPTSTEPTATAPREVVEQRLSETEAELERLRSGEPAEEASGVGSQELGGEVEGQEASAPETQVRDAWQEAQEERDAINELKQTLPADVKLRMDLNLDSDIFFQASKDGKTIWYSPSSIFKIRLKFGDRWREVLNLVFEEEVIHATQVQNLGGKERAASEFEKMWREATEEERTLVREAYGPNAKLTDSEWGAEMSRMREQASTHGRITESIHPKRGEAARRFVVFNENRRNSLQNESQRLGGRYAEAAAPAPQEVPTGQAGHPPTKAPEYIDGRRGIAIRSADGNYDGFSDDWVVDQAKMRWPKRPTMWRGKTPDELRRILAENDRRSEGRKGQTIPNPATSLDPGMFPMLSSLLGGSETTSPIYYPSKSAMKKVRAKAPGYTGRNDPGTNWDGFDLERLGPFRGRFRPSNDPSKWAKWDGWFAANGLGYMFDGETGDVGDEPSVFWDKLYSEVKTYQKWKAHEDEMRKSAGQQSRFEKDAVRREGAPDTVNVSDLGVGDKVNVRGEPVEVSAVDADFGVVTLDDGDRYGRDIKLEDGQKLQVDAVVTRAEAEAAKRDGVPDAAELLSMTFDEMKKQARKEGVKKGSVKRAGNKIDLLRMIRLNRERKGIAQPAEDGAADFEFGDEVATPQAAAEQAPAEARDNAPAPREETQEPFALHGQTPEEMQADFEARQACEKAEAEQKRKEAEEEARKTKEAKAMSDMYQGRLAIGNEQMSLFAPQQRIDKPKPAETQAAVEAGTPESRNSGTPEKAPENAGEKSEGDRYDAMNLQKLQAEAKRRGVKPKSLPDGAWRSPKKLREHLRKLDAEDNFDDIDAEAIREELAQEGIENGQVVNLAAAERDPFVQQVMEDAEQDKASRTKAESEEVRQAKNSAQEGERWWEKTTAFRRGLEESRNGGESTHVINTPERHALRAKIAEEYYEGAKQKGIDQGHEFHIVMGLPGAGKSSAVVRNIRKRIRAIEIDADEVKPRLPGFDGGAGAGRVHKESADIAEKMVMPHSMDNGDNIIFPTIGKNADKLLGLIRKAKEKGYKVYLYNVDIPLDESIARALTRYVETGRFVSPEYIFDEVGLHPQETFDRVTAQGVVDGYVEVSNDVPRGQPPRYVRGDRALAEGRVAGGGLEAGDGYGRERTGLDEDRPGDGRGGASAGPSPDISGNGGNPGADSGANVRQGDDNHADNIRGRRDEASGGPDREAAGAGGGGDLGDGEGGLPAPGQGLDGEGRARPREEQSADAPAVGNGVGEEAGRSGDGQDLGGTPGAQVDERGAGGDGGGAVGGGRRGGNRGGKRGGGISESGTGVVLGEGAVGDAGGARPRDAAVSSEGRGGERAAGSGAPGERAQAQRRNADNHVITDPDYLDAGGAKAKYRDNLAALRVLKTLREEGREATPEEREIIAKYVGWGRSEFRNGLFAYYGGEWEKERKELREVIGEDEFESARRSTLTAFWTPPRMAQSVWGALERLGFKGGRVHEPSVGNGVFFGTMPVAVRDRSVLSGADKDVLASEIAKQLYPGARITSDAYQEAALPDDFYDLVIGNFPFADITIRRDKYNKVSANLHDYFWLKSLGIVRPGGLVAAITSTGTMDKLNDAVRREIADKADVVSAIRLPEGTFSGVAGTDVVTDLIILRKRNPGEEMSDDTRAWLETVECNKVSKGDEWLPGVINQYYEQHPDHILGKLTSTHNQYGHATTVRLAKGENLQKRLDGILAGLPEGLYTPRTRAVAAPKTASAAELGIEEGTLRDGSLVAKNGEIWENTPQGLVQVNAPQHQKKKAAMLIGLRDTLNALRAAETTDGSDAQLKSLRKELNRRYDEFVRTYGPLNKKGMLGLMDGDPSSHMLLALERSYDKDKNKATKADIFTTRVGYARSRATHAENYEQAAGFSMNETGHLDAARVGEMMGVDTETAERELMGKGLAYRAPDGTLVGADEYLSGNVRDKLRQAEAAARLDPAFKPNVDALRKVLPADKGPGDITVNLGATWVPPEIMSKFASHVLGIPDTEDGLRFEYNHALGRWVVTLPENRWMARRIEDSAAFTNTYATQHRSFLDILDAALHDTRIRITRKDPYTGQSEVLTVESEEANTKAEKLKDEFLAWLWQDKERTKTLTRIYNDTFNGFVERKKGGRWLSFPGMTPSIKPRPHQVAAVEKLFAARRLLMAHEVGTGKTITYGLMAEKAKETGIASKPLLVVKNSTVRQVAAEIQRLFPGMNIFVGGESMTAAKRKRSMAQIANNNWDLVILTHDNLGSLDTDPAIEGKFIEGQIRELRAAADAVMQSAMQKKDRDRIRKNLLKRIESLRERLTGLLRSKKTDGVSTFQDLGFDMVMVDECQAFKKLPIATYRDRVKGIPVEGSKRASALLMNVQNLLENNPEACVVFGSGTPLDNSLVEAYVWQRYLQNDLLKEAGITSFDAWASNFGRTTTDLEMSPSGGDWKEVERFKEFVNLGELSAMMRQNMDVVFAADTGEIVRPNRHDSVDNSPETDVSREIIQDLEARAKAIKERRGKPKPGDDNMLVVCGDGRKAAVHPGLYREKYVGAKGTKADACIDRVAKNHKADPKAAQMIFCDCGVNDTPWGFNLYKYLRDGLVKAGFKPEQVAFFSSNLSPALRAALAEKMNNGEILVAIGSTDTMGTGINAQKRLRWMHHLDASRMMTPGSIEQRNGRGHRQGNTYKDVEVVTYVQTHSLDVFTWNLIKNKAGFINSFLRGENLGTIEEESDTISPDQIVAISSGDPRVFRKAKVEKQLHRLHLQEAAFEQSKRDQEGDRRAAQWQLGRLDDEIKDLRTAVDAADKTTGKPFKAEVVGAGLIRPSTHTERDAALSSALDAAVVAVSTPLKEKLDNDGFSKLETVARYRGFEIQVRWEGAKGNSRLRYVLKLPRDAKTTYAFSPNFDTNDKSTMMLAVFRSADATISGLKRRLASAIEDRETTARRIEDLSAGLDRKFESAEKITALELELQRLNDDLSGKNKKEGENGEPAAAPRSDGAVQFSRVESGEASGVGMERLKAAKKGVEEATGMQGEISEDKPDWVRKQSRGETGDIRAAVNLETGKFWLSASLANEGSAAHEGGHWVYAVVRNAAASGDPAAKAAAAKFAEIVSHCPESLRKRIEKRYGGALDDGEIFAHMAEEELNGNLGKMLAGEKPTTRTWWQKVKRAFALVWQALRRMFGAPLKASDLGRMDWRDALHQMSEAMRTGQRIEVGGKGTGGVEYARANGVTAEKLDRGPTIKVYRAMQLVDGKLYPPMAAKINGKMVEPTEIGVWYEADEHPELALPVIDKKTGKQKVDRKTGRPMFAFKLDKGNSSSIQAAYNPYWHTSRTPLNDQFTSASKRPELVIVECEVPESELTSGYRAEKAKDSVGEKDWHSGPVSSWLAEKGSRRKVILSRYNKVLRIVPNAEVAEEIRRMLDGTGISIPEGVVTPELRTELERLGVDISRQPRSAYTWEKIAGTKKNPQTITAPRFKAGAFSADATPKDMATAAKKSVERAGGVNTPRGLSINIPAFGDVVIAGSAGFKHGLHPRGKPYEKLIKKANADILPVVGEILKSSIPVNELRPRDSSTVGATILLGAAVNEEGAIIPVVSVVNHTRDDSQKPEVTIYPLKSVNAKDRTPAMLFYGTPDTPGLVGVNMADLVEQIKDEVPIFSLDVYDHFKQERPDGDFGGIRFSRTLPEESETPEEKAAVEEAAEENREKEGRSGRRAFVVRDGVREYQDEELVKTGGWFDATVAEGRKAKDGSKRWSIVGKDGKTYVSGMKTEEDAKWALNQKRAEVAATLDMLRASKARIGKVAEARRELIESLGKLRNDAQGWAKAIHEFMDKIGIPKDLQAKEAKFVMEMMGAKSPWALERRASQAQRFADTVLARMAIRRCRSEVEKLLKKHSGEVSNPGGPLRNEATGIRAAAKAIRDTRSSEEIDERCDAIFDELVRINNELGDTEDLTTAIDSPVRLRLERKRRELYEELHALENVGGLYHLHDPDARGMNGAKELGADDYRGDLEAWARGLKWLREVVSNASRNRRAAEEAKKAAADADRAQIISEALGGEKAITDVNKLKERNEETGRKIINAFLWFKIGSDAGLALGEALVNDKNVGFGKGKALEMIRLAHDCVSAENRRNEKADRRIGRMFSSYYGVDLRTGGRQAEVALQEKINALKMKRKTNVRRRVMIHDQETDTYHVELDTDGNGRPVTFNVSLSSLLPLVLWRRQAESVAGCSFRDYCAAKQLPKEQRMEAIPFDGRPEVSRRFGMMEGLIRSGFLPETIDEAENLLKENGVYDLAFKISEEFDHDFPEVDEMCRFMYGSSLEKVDYYCPAKREHWPIVGPKGVPGLEGFMNMTASFVRARTDNRLAFELYDIVDQLEHDSRLKNHLLTHYKLMDHARRVFSHPDMQKALVQVLGPSAKKHIDAFWNTIARGKAEKGEGMMYDIVEKIGSAFALAQTSRLTSMIKQFTSAPATWAVMPEGQSLANWFSGLAIWMLNPKEAMRYHRLMSIHVPNWRHRLKGHCSQAMEMAMNTKADAGTAIGATRDTMRMIRKIGSVPTRFGDAVGALSGSYPIWRFLVRKNMKNGMSKLAAERAACKEADRIINETQQSALAPYLGHVQTGKVMVWGMMFKSSPIALTRLFWTHARAFAQGRGSKMSHIRGMLGPVVATLLYSLAGRGLFSLFGQGDGDDDDESLAIRAAKNAGAALAATLSDGFAGGSLFKTLVERWLSNDWSTSRHFVDLFAPIETADDFSKLVQELQREDGPRGERTGRLAANVVGNSTGLPLPGAWAVGSGLVDASTADNLSFIQRLDRALGYSRHSVGAE